MTVGDYYNDFVLGQKWCVEVETTLEHDKEDMFVETNVETYHYSVPFQGRCPYLDDEVEYARAVDSEITLVIKRCMFV